MGRSIDEMAERLAGAASAALLKGRFDRALGAFESLIDREPSVARHRLRAADCLARLGRTPEAVDRYCQAARLYEAVGRETQALAVWRMAHALDPSSHDAAMGLLAAEAAAAAPGFPRPGRPRVEVRLDEEVTPVDVPVESLALQTSREAVLEELGHKQEIVSGPAAIDRIGALQARIERLEEELANARRVSLDAGLAADIARARRFGIPLAVIVLDGAGRDGERMRDAAERCLRASDTVGLLPGGRLVVSALVSSDGAARRVAAKVCQALTALPPSSGEVTAGIAMLPEEVELSRRPGPREMIAVAGAALERAIDAGHRTHVSRTHATQESSRSSA